MKPSVRPEIARQHWMLAVKDELFQQLSEQGYEVHRNYRHDDTTIDLAARKDGRWHFYEFIGPSIGDLPKVQALAEQIGAELRIVPINPPREMHIEVSNLDEALHLWMSEHERPSELFEIGHHTELEIVFGAEVDSIEVKVGSIRVVGSAMAGARVLSGDNDVVDESAYPFDFDVELDPHDLSIESVKEMHADLTEFYGPHPVADD
jgi:hypothetical protein